MFLGILHIPFYLILILFCRTWSISSPPPTLLPGFSNRSSSIPLPILTITSLYFSFFNCLSGFQGMMPSGTTLNVICLVTCHSVSAFHPSFLLPIQCLPLPTSDLSLSSSTFNRIECYSSHLFAKNSLCRTFIGEEEGIAGKIQSMNQGREARSCG